MVCKNAIFMVCKNVQPTADAFLRSISELSETTGGRQGEVLLPHFIYNRTDKYSTMYLAYHYSV